ncbi:hypothetical protein [Chengkuizengella marina]|nr:hypothetical protein [Chengkuizengella marina]
MSIKVNDQWTANPLAYKNAEQYWWMIVSHIKTVTETGKVLDFSW